MQGVSRSVLCLLRFTSTVILKWFILPLALFWKKIIALCSNFSVVPYQEVSLGTASLVYKRRFKSITQCPISQLLNCTHLHLWCEIFPHSCEYPSFRTKQVLFKLLTFFTWITRHIYTKLLTFSENSEKIKVGLHYRFSVILLMSAVISKQRILLRNEIV